MYGWMDKIIDYSSNFLASLDVLKISFIHSFIGFFLS